MECVGNSTLRHMVRKPCTRSRSTTIHGRLRLRPWARHCTGQPGKTWDRESARHTSSIHGRAGKPRCEAVLDCFTTSAPGSSPTRHPGGRIFQPSTYAYLLRNDAFSNFHSLQVQCQRRLSRGLQALVSYTYGKSLDNNSNDSSSHLIAAAIDPKRAYGPSEFDIRQTLAAAFSYNLPKAHVLKPLARDRALDGVFSARSATPVDVTYSADIGYGVYTWRPDVVAGQTLYLLDPNVAGGRPFNPDTFEFPNTYPGRQGTLGRNVLRGFPVEQLNLTVRREFPLYERARLQFRAEMFNALNHPSFSDPIGAMLGPQFGPSHPIVIPSFAP